MYNAGLDITQIIACVARNLLILLEFALDAKGFDPNLTLKEI